MESGDARERRTGTKDPPDVTRGALGIGVNEARDNTGTILLSLAYMSAQRVAELLRSAAATPLVRARSRNLNTAAADSPTR